MIEHVFKTREQWLTFRRCWIGSSDIAPLMGVRSYSNAGRMGVYVAKTKGEELNPAWADAERVAAGVHFELAAMEWFRKRMYPDAVLQPGGLTSYLHEEHDWMGCTPDGWLWWDDGDDPRCGVEAKWVEDSFGWPETEGQLRHVRPGDDVDLSPGCRWLAYYTQCQWSMAVTGAERWYLIAVVRGNRLLAYAIHRNEEDIGRMVEVARTFWHEHVLAGVPPEVGTDDPSAEQALRRLYPYDNGTTLQLDPSMLVHFQGRTCAAADAKRAVAAKEYHQASIARAMKGSTTALCGPWKCTYKANKNGARVMRLKETK